MKFKITEISQYDYDKTKSGVFIYKEHSARIVLIKFKIFGWKINYRLTIKRKRR